MSTNQDTLLAARFAALTPEPLAGNWDEVLERAGAAPKGHRGPDYSREVHSIVALLREAAQNVLRDREWNAREAGPACFAVTTNEARPLAKALDDAVPAKKGRLSYRFNAPRPSRQVWITFNPYLPHGKTHCLRCG